MKREKGVNAPGNMPGVFNGGVSHARPLFPARRGKLALRTTCLTSHRLRLRGRSILVKLALASALVQLSFSSALLARQTFGELELAICARSEVRPWQRLPTYLACDGSPSSLSSPLLVRGAATPRSIVRHDWAAFLASNSF